MSDPSAKDPKIIVDSDWKSQVEAEKKELEQKKTESTAEKGDAGEQSAELPPASFPMLVSMIATQAMTALGQLPDPIEQKPVVRPSVAKHHIDTLAILEEKTKGNLSPEEAQMLEEVLHQLRMAFVAAKSS